MLELTVTASGRDQHPAILFQEPNDVTHLHAANAFSWCLPLQSAVFAQAPVIAAIWVVVQFDEP